MGSDEVNCLSLGDACKCHQNMMIPYWSEDSSNDFISDGCDNDDDDVELLDQQMVQPRNIAMERVLP